MLSKFSKKELEEMAKRMRAVAIVPKVSLNQKMKVPATTTSTPTGDEETFSGPVFRRKRKRKALVAPTEHSHLDWRAPFHHATPSKDQSLPRDMVVIEEGEVESSKGKNLWNLSLDAPKFLKKALLPAEERERLMAYDKIHFAHEAIRKFGQALATICLVATKMKERKATKDLKAQKISKLRKEMEHLQSELQHTKDLQ